MNYLYTTNFKTNEIKRKKILLALLPYWDPMIPPNGIAHLKQFLRKYDYDVKLADVILEESFQQIYRDYFDLLKKSIPESHWGNFYNIGHDLLFNHMMAGFNYHDEKEYIELVKLLVYKIYYYNLKEEEVLRLNHFIETFYTDLRRYFLELVAKEQPDVVGLTAYRGTLPSVLFVCREIKKAYPHIKTIMGGGVFVDTCAPGTPNFEILLEYSKDFLDKMMIGQGELLLLKYLRGELPESKRVYTKQDIDGQILGFKEIDIPDYSDFDLGRYHYLPATASASCPNQCSFCSATGYYGKHRVKDVTQTAEEMIRLHQMYGHQLFFMTDSLLNPMVTGLAEEFLEADVSLYYDTYFRISEEAANFENTMLWRRGGLYRVRMGTESGSERILKIMGKGITPKQIRAAVPALASAGIKTTTYWVIGHPGETEADFCQTLDLVAELKNDIYQAESNPFRYHDSVQVDTDKWRGKKTPLFPGKFNSMLVFNSHTLNIAPLREEVYQRTFRFEEHCKKLGIPNPYSLSQSIHADQRWAALHQNAVPPLLDFLSRKKIHEKKRFKPAALAVNIRDDDEEFDF